MGRWIVPRLVASSLTLIMAGALAGCGNTTGDRAASGGALGAGIGAAGAAITGGNPLGGALLGGAAGAAAGALTNEDDIDLGKPLWR